MGIVLPQLREVEVKHGLSPSSFASSAPNIVPFRAAEIHVERIHGGSGGLSDYRVGVVDILKLSGREVDSLVRVVNQQFCVWSFQDALNSLVPENRVTDSERVDVDQSEFPADFFQHAF